METPCSARIIQDVDLALKALEIVYRENGAAVEGLADINGHRRKVVVKGKSVICGGARTKGEGCECELAKKMLFHSDVLKLCLMKRRKISEFFPDKIFFMIEKLAMQTNGIKIYSTINQSYFIIRTFDLRRTLPKYLRTFLYKNAVVTIGLADQSG